MLKNTILLLLLIIILNSCVPFEKVTYRFAYPLRKMTVEANKVILTRTLKYKNKSLYYKKILNRNKRIKGHLRNGSCQIYRYKELNDELNTWDDKTKIDIFISISNIDSIQVNQQYSIPNDNINIVSFSASEWFLWSPNDSVSAQIDIISKKKHKLEFYIKLFSTDSLYIYK